MDPPEHHDFSPELDKIGLRADLDGRFVPEQRPGAAVSRSSTLGHAQDESLAIR
jgi:hypothetical protein